MDEISFKTQNFQPRIITTTDKSSGPFNCPFCSQEKSCYVKMDTTRHTGYITCSICLGDYQCGIKGSTKEMDVYRNWLIEKG